ncbi:MAG TPA: CaiB/BaiF CoA-transferase family protein [Acidimicrobiales bacterium]|jgi:crotonobetainyl-CoA:carnitine CoA-transferase CaiB-like acyl-CoA transferase|nr:CaiB/BaiF CoA-transferase family protein [Acidimicrobiales bacterium]|tara:strand:- start:5407 stop:6603 length:1197 start_codon:yes stop_codon:yes gene_type:complete
MAGPLDGYKILDLTQVVSGPFATMLLADQGADVIKVEPVSGLGDITRLPSFDKGGIGAFYMNNNRGKQSISLDLSQDAGREVIKRLIEETDVFVQNFRPGAIERLGLGYEDLVAINPNLIYISISGFGPTGPYSGRPVLDPVIQGVCGVISRQLNPQIPFPDLIRNLFADKSTALTVAQATTAALLARERTGNGQFVEIPMVDACMYFFWPDAMMDLTMVDEDANGGILLSTVYNLTECSDGKIVYFAASDGQRAGVCAAVGHPEWAEDERFSSMAALAANPQNFVILGEMLADAFLLMTCDEAIEALIEADVPSGPVLTGEEAISDPQIIHNGTLVEWEHPDAGIVRQPKPAARFSATPAEPKYAAAHRGQHNEETLLGLGYSSEEINQLKETGAIG